MWTATLKTVQDNSVPNDTVNITIEFSDGTKTFGKDYNIHAGTWKGEQDLKDLVAAELQKLEEFETVVTSIKSIVGKEISKTGEIKDKPGVKGLEGAIIE